MTLVSYFAFTYRYRKFLLLRCIILMPQRCLDMLVIKQGIEHILLASFRPDIASSKLASFSYAIALLSSRYRKKFVLAYCTRCELQSAHLPGVHCQPLHNTATAQCPTQDTLPASVRVYIQVVYTLKSAHTKSQADSFRFGGSRAQTTKKKEPALNTPSRARCYKSVSAGPKHN